MEPLWLSGIVKDGVFYSISGTTKFKIGETANGIYMLDITHSNPATTLIPADLNIVREDIRKSKKTYLISGYAYKNQFVPNNYMKYKRKLGNIPVKVDGMVADDLDFVNVIFISNRRVLFFWDILYPMNLIALRDEILQRVENGIDLQNLKGVTPEQRIIYALLRFEKIQQEEERRRQEEAERMKNIDYRIQKIISDAGGKYIRHNTMRGGESIEVIWEVNGERISTLIDKEMHVQNAGFCVSGYDKTLSLGAAVTVLEDYIDEGDYIYRTRSVK